MIYSHEISEKAFLEKMADDTQKLLVIENDFKNNSLLYHFKEKSTRKISIFPGFCKEHDENLFKELDNFSDKFDSTFINKQSLRSIKKEIVEYMKKNSIAEELKKELEIIPSINSSNYFKDFVKKLSTQKERLNRLNIIYKKIFLGLEKNEHVIKYKIFEVKPLKYIFKKVVDLSQNNQILTPFFIYKIHSKLIIGYFDNDDAKTLMKELVNNDYLIHALIYDEKKNLIISRYFLNELTEEAKNILLQNEELYKFGLNEYIILKRELGLDEFNKPLEHRAPKQKIKIFGLGVDVPRPRYLYFYKSLPKTTSLIFKSYHDKLFSYPKDI